MIILSWPKSEFALITLYKTSLLLHLSYFYYLIIQIQAKLLLFKRRSKLKDKQATVGCLQLCSHDDFMMDSIIIYYVITSKHGGLILRALHHQ